jgi:isopentenyldiphosphate isomerase
VVEEIVDVVDEEDRVVGQAPRSEVRARKLWHRGTSILVRNSSGEIYVHRRTDSKDVWPGVYDFFVGGMVAAGESYEQGAVREVAEELGITGAPLRFLFKRSYSGADNPHWDQVYDLVWDGEVRMQESEVAWGDFLSEPELRARLPSWKMAPDSLEILDRALAAVR